MLNFVLCDDNSGILAKLSKMLESIFIKHNFDAQVLFTSGNANEILRCVKSNSVNVLFVDIDLHSDISGLQLAKMVRRYDKTIYIIFTTGHLEYAMLAYKFKTFDYLPKPITYEKLEETVLRLYDDIAGNPSSYLKIDNGVFVNSNDILFIKKDGMKLVYYAVDKEYEAYGSFSKIEDDLPGNFIRCHRSCIVNVDRIKKIEKDCVYFDGGLVCDIGPKYKKFLMEVVENYGDVW